MLATLLFVISLAKEPLYSSSVVGTEFDFIKKSDPSTPHETKFVRIGECEMPDKAADADLMQKAFQFQASFKDGAAVHIGVHHRVGERGDAQMLVAQAVDHLARIPSVLRKGVNRIVINVGDSTAFSDQGLIVLYSENMQKRIGTHDLEETMFHESVHATWDKDHAAAPGWRAAQDADDAFATKYGQDNPTREDLAESALFAVTLIHHPDRIPPADAAAIKAQIPARIAYVAKLFPKGRAWHDLPK